MRLMETIVINFAYLSQTLWEDKTKKKLNFPEFEIGTLLWKQEHWY